MVQLRFWMMESSGDRYWQWLHNDVSRTSYAGLYIQNEIETGEGYVYLSQ